VIIYKIATNWLYMYEWIDKIMGIHTPILNDSASVLELEGWHLVFLWSLSMPQDRYISIDTLLVAHKKG
jgi:hypothetical protein